MMYNNDVWVKYCRYGESLDSVKNLVSDVLRFFEQIELKENAKESKEKKKKITLDYGISYLKTRLFLTPFAPCYHESSSRYAFGEKESTFLLLQSSNSFNLLNKLAGNDWNKILELR